MADIALAMRSAWAGLLQPGRVGRADGAAGITAMARDDLALARLIARRTTRADVTERVRASYGIDPPSTPRRAAKDGVAFIWSGPGEWLVVAERAQHPRIVDDLRTALAGLAAVSEQSDGFAVLRLSGPKARDTLMKGVSIDLHPRAFSVDGTALTVISHIGVHLWQIDDSPTYDIAVPRSLAASFWHWLAESAAEFGLDVVAAP